MNRFVILYLYILFVFASTSHGHDIIGDHLLFNQAATCYKQRDFEKALNTYETISQKTGAVLYNMGLCHHYLAHYPEAIAYLRGAQKNVGYKKYLVVNDIINQSMQKAGIPVASDSLWYTRLLYQYGARPIFWTQIGLLFAFLMIFLSLLYYKRRLSKWRRLLLYGVQFGLLCWLVLTYYNQSLQSGIIKNPTTIHVGPHANSPVIAQFGECTSVTIKKKSDGWYKVYGNGILGWIFQENIILIP
jgi:Bacterial SH3 domain